MPERGLFGFVKESATSLLVGGASAIGGGTVAGDAIEKASQGHTGWAIAEGAAALVIIGTPLGRVLTIRNRYQARLQTAKATEAAALKGFAAGAMSSNPDAFEAGLTFGTGKGAKEVFEAGVETGWMMGEVAHHPEMREEIERQIHEATGGQFPPDMQSRRHYTEDQPTIYHDPKGKDLPII